MYLFSPFIIMTDRTSEFRSADLFQWAQVVSYIDLGISVGRSVLALRHVGVGWVQVCKSVSSDDATRDDMEPRGDGEESAIGRRENVLALHMYSQFPSPVSMSYLHS